MSEFPNTRTSFLQTHFLVIDFVLSNESKLPQVVEARESGGMFEVADLCTEITQKFEEKYVGEKWEDKEYIDTLEGFIDKELTE